MASIEELKSLVEAQPESFEARFSLGMAWFGEGDYSAAARELQVAACLDPGLPAAWRCLGQAYERLGRVEEAATAWRSGIEAAERSGWLQPAKEMRVFLKRIGLDE